MTANVAVVALAAALFAVSGQPAKGGLPLRHGRYVEIDAPCLGASSSSESWFGGGYAFQAPHVQCKAVQVARLAPDRYRVVERCFENADRARPFAIVEHVRLLSHTEYELENRFGAFRSRWCPG